MRYLKLSLLVLALAGAPTHANEAEPAAEGGGEGAAAARPPRDQREYTEKFTKLNALAAKLEESTKHYAAVVKEKEEAKGPEREALLKEMVEMAKQRSKDESEYARLKTEIAQRYPNQGERGAHRAIEKAEVPAAGEAAPSLDQVLKETKALIDAKYEVFAPPKPAAAARGPASRPEAAPRLRLER